MVNSFLSSFKPMLDFVNVAKIPILSDWASNTFRTIVASIDNVIYGVISILYDILDQIVKTSIFGPTDIQEFATRVYTFLGIIMVFKVTFSLISYLVNPDTISDNTNGVGNIAKNFVITLVLIIITPYAFDFLYNAQNAIINDNLIPRLILGTSGENVFKVQIDPDFCKDQEVNVNSSDFMALVTLRPFYQINDEIGSSSNDTVEEYCEAQSVDELLIPGIYKATANNSEGEEVYVVDYSGVLSTAAGVVVFLLLLTACMDVALRTIKLGVLEIIAPIPIISYVDPKSGKDGMFKKWLDEVWKTWLSLFVRLAVIYFAIYIISLINNNVDSAMSNGLWVTLFLLIGALIFAKQFPKLIENIFGIQFDELNLHPIKKVTEQAALGKTVVGAGVAAGAATLAIPGAVGANLVNNYMNREKGKFTLKNNLKSGISGAFGGLYNGLRVGYGAGSQGKINVIREAGNAVQKSSENRNLNTALTDQGVVKNGPFARQRFAAINRMTDIAGIQGSSGTTDEMKNQLQDIAIEKQLVLEKKRNASEVINLQTANMSDELRQIINSIGQFERTVKKNAEGKIDYTSDGRVKWNHEIESFSELVKSGKINVSGMNHVEVENLEAEYEARRKAEINYRDAYNDELALNRRENKLTKQKDKFDAVNKPGK